MSMHGPEQSQTPPPRSPPPASKSNVPWIVVGLVAAGVLLLLYFKWNPTPPNAQAPDVGGTATATATAAASAVPTVTPTATLTVEPLPPPPQPTTTATAQAGQPPPQPTSTATAQAGQAPPPQPTSTATAPRKQQQPPVIPASCPCPTYVNCVPCSQPGVIPANYTVPLPPQFQVPTVDAYSKGDPRNFAGDPNRIPTAGEVKAAFARQAQSTDELVENDLFLKKGVERAQATADTALSTANEAKQIAVDTREDFCSRYFKDTGGKTTKRCQDAYPNLYGGKPLAK